MVQAKPTTPVWNTADPLYTNVICALPFMDGIGVQATDLSGQGRHGALVAGATWFNDPTLGVVVQLDGTSGYVALSSLLNAAILATPFAGQCSISMWLRLRTSTPTVNTKTGLMDLGTLNNPGTASKWPASTPMSFGETPGTGYVNVFRTSGRINIGSLNATDKTQWHHVVITYQAGGSWKLYLNGALFNTTAADGTLPATLAPALGRSTESGGAGPFFLDGWLGDFRVYNKELTAQEALGLFNSPWYLYTVSTPLGQDRLLAEMVDALPGRSSYSARAHALMVDALPGRAPYSARAVALMVDAVPYKDPQTPIAPPNDPGNAPFAMTDAFNPRLKPLNAGPPTLNADPVNSGLVLAMPLTEGAGGPQDRSGSANHSILGGTIAWDTSLSSFFFPNRVKAPGLLLSTGAGANFARVTDALSLRPTTAVTVAAWVRPRGFPSSTAILAAKQATAISYGLLINTAGQFQFRLTDVIDGSLTISSGAFSNAQQGAPFFVVGTYDGVTQNLYVNGVLVATTGQAGNIQYAGSADFFIGGDNVGNGNANASIDAVHVWNRAISAAEVRQLYDTQYAGIAPSGVPVVEAGSGAFGNYSNGALSDGLALMVDASPFRSEVCARSLAMMVDATPFRQETCSRLVALMVDAVPAIQNAAGMGIGSINPPFGSFAGGTPVTIKGFAFRNVTQVFVGGVLCTSVVVVDQQTITAVTGAHVAGMVDVRVDSSSMGTAIAPNLYQYVGGLVTAANTLMRGKLFHTGLWHQDPPGSFYSGMTAPLGVDTTLPFTLADNPTVPQAVEVYVRRLGETGYGLMRYGLDFDVDITLKKIIWKGVTAAHALIASDEMVVHYPGRN
jgi:hypothetical protein